MSATMSLDERTGALDVIYPKSALANMEDGSLGAGGMGMDNLKNHPASGY